MTELNPVAARFVDDILAHARSRGSSGGVVALRFAGEAVRVHFSTERLRLLFLPAFEHIRVADDVAAALSLSIVEGEPFPKPVWPPEAYRSCGEIVGFADSARYL